MYLLFNKTTGKSEIVPVIDSKKITKDDHFEIHEYGVGKIAESKAGDEKIESVSR